MPTAVAPAADAFEGTLERLVAEDVDRDASTELYGLHTPKGVLDLTFEGGAPADFVNGARVRVQGRLDGSVVHVEPAVASADGTSSAQVLLAAPGASTGVRRVAVVPINFTNDRSRPFTRGFAAGIIFNNTRSARSYFAEESKGRVSLQGTTFDWVALPLANTSCDYRAFARLAKQELAARGIDVASFTNFVFAFPQTNTCSWRGLGHLPGWHTWINGTPSLRTAVHELGHNFGAHHASSITCRSGGGSRVALSANCTTAEYGDPFSTMGAADRRLDHNLHLAQLGYIDLAGTRTVSASGTYGLYHAAYTTGTRVLRIPRGNGTWLYLEYRRPYRTLFDNFASTDPVVRGVTIRIGADWRAILQTKLIDTRPGTASFLDAPLGLDRTFRDYLSGISVTVTARGKLRAWVRITIPPDRTPPTAPGSFSATGISPTAVDLRWTASTDDRGVSGYRIGRDGILIASLPATATGFTDSGLQAETTYSYTIRAVDQAGNLGPIATKSAATGPIDRPPTAPVATLEVHNARWANLSWTAASDDHAVVAYRVLRNGVLYTTTGGNVLGIHIPFDGAVYAVVAVDSAGQLSPASNEVRLEV